MSEHIDRSGEQWVDSHTVPKLVANGDISDMATSSTQPAFPWARHLDSLWVDDFQIRWDASKRLATFGEAILPDLLALIEHPEADIEMLWFLVRLLGQFKHPDVATALVDLLERDRPTPRGHKAVDESIHGGIASDIADGDIANNDVTAAAATALANFGTDALPPLQRLLEVPEKRKVAVRALAYIRSSDTIPTLIGVTIDRDPVVREAAIEALCSLPCRRDSLEVLLNALTDVSARVRTIALKGIAVWANSHLERDWVGIVRPLLLDINGTVAAAAVRVLGRVGSEAAVDELSLVLQDALAPQPLKVEAVRALTWIETPEAIAALQQVLSSAKANDNDATLECIRGLGRYEPSSLMAAASQALQDWMASLDLSQQSVEALRAIAHSLGRLGQPDSIPPLISLLQVEDNGVRFHAIAALKQFNRAIVTHLLQQNASISSEGDREGIELALSEMV
ncbi:MAG: HEAT repeat domain-containing protein [Cyanobacteria bacterium P01_G01_bin.4]